MSTENTRLVRFYCCRSKEPWVGGGMHVSAPIECALEDGVPYYDREMPDGLTVEINTDTSAWLQSIMDRDAILHWSSFTIMARYAISHSFEAGARWARGRWEGDVLNRILTSSTEWQRDSKPWLVIADADPDTTKTVKFHLWHSEERFSNFRENFSNRKTGRIAVAPFAFGASPAYLIGVFPTHMNNFLSGLQAGGRYSQEDFLGARNAIICGVEAGIAYASSLLAPTAPTNASGPASPAAP